MRALALLFFALLPGAAMASGFNLPWWGEALLFLMINPWGWALLAMVLAVIGGLIYKAGPQMNPILIAMWWFWWRAWR